MRGLLPFVAAAIVGGAVFAAACSDSKDDPGSVDAGDEASIASDGGAPTDDDGINASGVGAGTGAPTGLPCDVQQLLENYCIACHLAGTKFALLNYDDLQKPAPSDPTKTMAVRAVERMTRAEMPPKPAEAPDADEIGAFKDWVDAKTPKNDTACTTPPPGASDGGATGPSVCTSNTTWKSGDQGSESMHPGGACITCHTQRGGPAYKVAGTVYPTAHEPTDCNGTATPVSIVITDAKGKAVTLQSNQVGNFFLRGKVQAPFRAKVVSGAKERAMAGTVTAGDCNSCHTEKGANGAPGRIMAP